MYTKEQIFLHVATHLMKQGKQALNEGKGCAYLTEDGNLMCAVGCLIPKSMYSPGMEGKVVSGLVADRAGNYDLPDYIIEPDNRPMLRALQRLHDNTSMWAMASTMYAALEAVSIALGLDDVMKNVPELFGQDWKVFNTQAEHNFLPIEH